VIENRERSDRMLSLNERHHLYSGVDSSIRSLRSRFCIAGAVLRAVKDSVL